MPSATRPQRPGALVGRRLRDLLDLQLLDLVAEAVALDAREPGVDHVADARHGQRGLGDVGREHDAPAAATARRRAPARPPTAARTAAGSRRCAYGRRARCLRSTSAVSRISRSPGRNTRMSPRPLRATAPRPRRRSPRRAPPRRRPRRRPSRAAGSAPRPGYMRPDTSITGAGPVGVAKCCAKRSASIVAEVTIDLQVGPARQQLACR